MALQKDRDASGRYSSSDSSSGFDSDEEYQGAATTDQTESSKLFEKDSDEEELERLVLGDAVGFRANLFKDAGDFETIYDAQGQQLLVAEDDTAGGYGLEDVADTDLFMVDTGAAAAGNSKSPASGEQHMHADANGPAWIDSDDDRLSVSLASATRLRKLRTTEAEDVVSGTEYCRRLRLQYLRLNPPPAWAKQTAATTKSKRRRRRSAAATGSSSEDDDRVGDRGATDSTSDSDDDSDHVSAQPLEKFLRNATSLRGGTTTGRKRLRPEVIDIQRTREIPDKHKAGVECLSFHPEFPVLLSASSASILYLHHIAPDAQPTPNPRLTSVQIKQVDVRRAEFLYPKGDKIVLGGRRKYFHTWDLPSGLVQKTTNIAGHRLEHKTMERFRLSPCGRYMGIVASTKKGGGVINVLSVSSMQWIAAARLSSRHGIADYAWWSTGDGMTILGKDGQVGEYSMETRTFLGIWHDEGCIGGIVVALGGHQGPAQLGDDRWVAVGSNSGITNLYDRTELLLPAATTNKQDPNEMEPLLKERPSPRRCFQQLVHPITTLSFSPDGQLLAFATQHKKDAIRLVHLPSCTVYRNWPTEQTALGRITAVAFSRESNVLAVGNDAGKIRLWDIRS